MKYKTTITLLIFGVVLSVLMATAYYNSLDNQITRNGFTLNYEGPSTPFYHEYVLKLPIVNVTSIDTLQLYAHEMGETTIYSYTNHVTDYSGTKYYYFVTDNNTMYYTQFQFISDPPYPLENTITLFITVVCGAAIISGGLAVYSYYKTRNATDETKESKPT